MVALGLFVFWFSLSLLPGIRLAKKLDVPVCRINASRMRRRPLLLDIPADHLRSRIQETLLGDYFFRAIRGAASYIRHGRGCSLSSMAHHSLHDRFQLMGGIDRLFIIALHAGFFEEKNLIPHRLGGASIIDTGASWPQPSAPSASTLTSE